MEQSYKEKYEDILARLERAKNDNEVCDERFCCVIDDLIPELAESKDERIRKEIIEVIESLSLEKEYEYIAWLEKQGQVKESTISQHENKMCKENDNSLTSEDEKIRKWIINEIKIKHHNLDEENVDFVDKAIAWLERQGEKLPVGFYYVNSEGKKFYSDTLKYGDVILHVEKQSEQKTEENKGNIGGISPNPEWGEDDEAFLDDILCKLEHDLILNKDEKDWLKSLKGRAKPQWKPSEDDIIILEKVIKGELEPKVFQATLHGILEQLKKL